jgi:outer membrane murein-binding lipoprotein Lpp
MTRTRVGLAIVAAVCIGAWAGGCQEEQAPDVKMNRLISAENRQLKLEIKTLEEQITRCEKEKQDAQKGHQEQIEKVTSILIEASKEQSAEIEQLRAEVARLEKGESPAPPPVNQEVPETDSAGSPQTDENAPPPLPPPAE